MEKDLICKFELIEMNQGNEEHRQILDKLEKKEYSVMNNQRWNWWKCMWTNRKTR